MKTIRLLLPAEQEMFDATEQRMPHTQIKWTVPFWSHKQKAFAEIRKSFPAFSFVRIVLFYAAVFVAIGFELPRWLPELDVNWVEMFFFVSVSTLVLIGIACLSTFIPPAIKISQKGVMVREGPHYTLHLFKDIAAIRIDENTLPLPLIRINYLSQQDEKVYPIAPTVSIKSLKTMIAQCQNNR